MVTQTDVRLPTGVRPARYVLTLTPDLENFTFTGVESIDIEVQESTNRVTLHALELQISSCDVTLGDGATIPSMSIDLSERSETATITFGAAIPAGSATLHLRFTGTLNDQLRGFYRSQYAGPDGQTKYLATTQFEATDARRAFPCWDEPAVKATFDVTLVVPENLAAICNTAEASVTPMSGGLKAVRFKESPRMSTYLLAFIVGDLASVQDRAPNGTLVRVWATRGREEQGRLALENAIGILNFFNNYFGISYPLEKLDHIAIPDFAAGAMENWGAITYRETALLYDPVNSAAFTRQRILEVVAHEMAHMWFGDLVTMEWWDDLWLNESFASWIGDKAVDSLYPDWQMWTQFVSHDTNGGLSLDGLRNSHPIEVPVYDPAQIRELFDAISYNKGAAVLRMLEDYIGEASFRRGLQAYLAKHQYANARTEDLWLALGEASGMPVPDVMATWIRQTGFPLLHARAEQEGDDVKLSVTQRRFLYEHLLDDREDDPTLWKVPVTAARPNVEPARFLMEGREAEAALGHGALAREGWTKVNAGQTGFYRVNYTPEDWDKLQEAVLKLELPAIDRLGLQNDAYALARGGYLPATRFLSLAESYQNETDATVWTDLAVNLGGIENLILQQPYLDKLDAFGRNLFRDIVRRVGWDATPNEGQLDAILRSTALSMAGGYEDPEVIAEAKARFTRFLDNPSSLHPDIRGIVVGIVGQEGDRALFDTLWDLARKADLQEEKLRFLRGTTRFKQPELLLTTLERSMNPEDIRSQDTVTVIGAVAGNRIGRELAWDFIKENWAELDRRYGRGGFAIASLVGITGGFTSLDKAQEVEEFFATHPAPSAARTIQQSLERIRINAKWLERNSGSLAEWFSSR